MSEKKRSFFYWMKPNKLFRRGKHNKKKLNTDDSWKNDTFADEKHTGQLEALAEQPNQCGECVEHLTTQDEDQYNVNVPADEFDLFVQLSNSPTGTVPPSVGQPLHKPSINDVDFGRRLQFRPSIDQPANLSGRNSLFNDDLRRVMSVIERKPSVPKPTSYRRDLARASFRSRSVREKGANKRLLSPCPIEPQVDTSHNLAPTSPHMNLKNVELEMINHTNVSDLYRVRSFKLTRKGVVNLGDTFRARSVVGLASNSHENGPHTEFRLSERHSSAGYNLHSLGVTQIDHLQSPRGSHTPDRDGFDSSRRSTVRGQAIRIDDSVRERDQGYVESDEPIRIQIVGFPNVGKTALCRQMITSEFLGARMESMSEDTVERYVTVELDDQTWNIVLIDNFGEAGADELAMVNTIRLREKSDSSNDSPYSQNALQLLPNSKSTGSTLLKDVLVYLLVYAVDDARSYDYASKVLQLLSKSSSQQIIMLVANKADLVRRRIVPTEKGKRLAHLHGCKYFEVSTAINHLVDELLVGIILQIKKLRQSRLSPTHLEVPDMTERRISSLRLHGEAIVRYLREKFDTKSCENIQLA